MASRAFEVILKARHCSNLVSRIIMSSKAVHHLHLDDLLLGCLVPLDSHAPDQILETLEVHFLKSCDNFWRKKPQTKAKILKKSLKLVCFQLKSFHPDADVAADTCADFLDDSRTSVELKIGEIAAAGLPNDLRELVQVFFVCLKDNVASTKIRFIQSMM